MEYNIKRSGFKFRGTVTFGVSGSTEAWNAVSPRFSHHELREEWVILQCCYAAEKWFANASDRPELSFSAVAAAEKKTDGTN